jgi:hypothetical protein
LYRPLQWYQLIVQLEGCHAVQDGWQLITPSQWQLQGSQGMSGEEQLMIAGVVHDIAFPIHTGAVCCRINTTLQHMPD